MVECICSRCGMPFTALVAGPFVLCVYCRMQEGKIAKALEEVRNINQERLERARARKKGNTP